MLGPMRAGPDRCGESPPEQTTMKKLSIVVVSLFLTAAYAAPAAAQESPRTLGSYATELSFSYSVLHDIGETGPYGIMMDFGKAITKRVSLVGEFNIHKFTQFDETYTQAAIGARVGHMFGSRTRLFFQFVAGPQNNFGETGIAMQPGFGVNVRASRHVDARFQMDFPIVRWEGDTYQQYRFSFGLGLPFGGK